MKTKKPSLSTYFKVPNPSLRSYFALVENGQPDEYRTPFYKGKTLPEVLDAWIKRLAPLETEWPSLYAFEMDLSKKVGPLSVMKPFKDRVTDVESYYGSISLDSSPLDKGALDRTLTEFRGLAGLRRRSEQTTVQRMKLNTNSGSPYFEKRRNVVGDSLTSDLFYQVPDHRTKILTDSGEYFAAAVLGWRGQEGGPSKSDVKQRVVWMMPFVLNIQELRMYQPFIEAAKKLFLVPAWVGEEAVEHRITALFNTKRPNDPIIATDFTKFDQHFNVHLQNAAKDILGGIIHESDADWLNDVFPIKYDIPLICTEDVMYEGPHGMASGSGGTNVDETIVHRALQHECALRQGKELNPNSQCLGDDGILSYSGITVEDVMETYTSHGLEMNESKQYVSTLDTTYLRRWYHNDYRKDGRCVGVYSTCRALGRLAEQERYYDDWSKEMVALRQLSILENIKNHPLREEFVDYCMRGDKYRLGLDIPGFFDKLSKFAKGATDNMPDFLGYTRSLTEDVATGINKWWIVNYLKSKA